MASVEKIKRKKEKSKIKPSKSSKSEAVAPIGEWHGKIVELCCDLLVFLNQSYFHNGRIVSGVGCTITLDSINQYFRCVCVCFQRTLDSPHPLRHCLQLRWEMP